MSKHLRSTLSERDEARLSSRGGFAFLVANGLMWIITAALTFVLPVHTAALVIIWQGTVGLPLAFALERLLKFPRLRKENTLLPLLIQTAMVQLPALLTVIIVYTLEPLYVPAALAAILGGHFLPYMWINRTPLYGVLGGIVSFGPFLLPWLLHARAFNYTGFLVGGACIVVGVILRAQIEREERRQSTPRQRLAV